MVKNGLDFLFSIGSTVADVKCIRHSRLEDIALSPPMQKLREPDVGLCYRTTMNMVFCSHETAPLTKRIRRGKGRLMTCGASWQEKTTTIGQLVTNKVITQGFEEKNTRSEAFCCRESSRHYRNTWGRSSFNRHLNFFLLYRLRTSRSLLSQPLTG